MVAADIVPLDAVLVDIVEDAQARFFGLVNFEFGVVWLRSLEVASGAPRLVAPTGGSLVGFGQFDAGAGPEPSVDQDWLQVLAIAALEIAEATTRPDVGKFLYFFSPISQPKFHYWPVVFFFYYFNSYL